MAHVRPYFETFLEEHARGTEILMLLRQWRKIGADEFDIAEAVYWACSGFYNGMGCPLYAALCANQFTPGACANGPEPETMAADIYLDLEDILQQ